MAANAGVPRMEPARTPAGSRERRLYMQGWNAELLMREGRWDEAAAKVKVPRPRVS